MRFIPACCVALVPIFACAGAASAHPHVWIEARAEVVYAQGRPVAVRNAWTFDPAYSAFLVLGAPRGEGGRIEPAALAAEAQKAVGSVKDYGYFTDMRAGDVRFDPGEPRDQSLAFDGERATLRFELPFVPREPLKSAPEARLEVMDPSYFVSFSYAPGEAVAVTGTGGPCTATLRRPKGFSAEDAKTLAAGILTALTAGDASERIGNSAAIACPTP